MSRGYEIICRLADSYEGKADIDSAEWNVLMALIGSVVDGYDVTYASEAINALALKLGIVEDEEFE